MATHLNYSSISLYSPPPLRRQFTQNSTVRLHCTSSSLKNNPNTKSSPSSSKDPESQNLLLKMAWYSSELLGIAASLIRPPKNDVDSPPVTSPELSVDDSGFIDRATVTGTIKEDFQRSYFVTGNLTMDAYEEKCEFADPAGSFKGLNRFKRNCANFGSLIQKSNMKLLKWEDFEVHIRRGSCFPVLLMPFIDIRIHLRLIYKQEKSIGHWRFSCILSFPWKPILSATGYTEYYYDEKSGKVCRHVEHWNVPKMALLKQIFRPSRGLI